MTAPVLPTPTWCASCEIHRATSTTPLCPVCLDKKKRGEQ